MKESLIRSLSGVVYVVLLVAASLFSKLSFLVLFGLFLFVATIEFCDLVNLKKINAVLISSILFFLFSFFQISTKTKFFLIIAILFVSIKLIHLLFSKTNLKIDNISKYVYLIGYITLPIIILTQIPVDIFGNSYKPEMIISIFILIWVNDTFAYVVGKTLGKTKLFESISPKKTIEGFLGGLLFATLTGVFIAVYFLPVTIYFWIATALIVGIFGTIGDLIESKFKRNANVKDSGTIMPGHGGILDRLDSAIFIAPFIFLFIQIIQFLNND